MKISLISFRLLLFFFHFLFRFVFVDFILLSLVSFYFVFISLISFRFVSFLLISFRFVSFSLISFRFVSFRFYFVSHFIGALLFCPMSEIRCEVVYIYEQSDERCKLRCASSFSYFTYCTGMM